MGSLTSKRTEKQGKNLSLVLGAGQSGQFPWIRRPHLNGESLSQKEGSPSQQMSAWASGCMRKKQLTYLPETTALSNTLIRELKQQRRRRLRKRHLKSEFALPETLSRLFHLV